MSEQLIIGNASHLYAVQEGWGQLPANIQYGYTHGIVVDDEDRVYVHHTGKESVVVFDKTALFSHPGEVNLKAVPMVLLAS